MFPIPEDRSEFVRVRPHQDDEFADVVAPAVRDDVLDEGPSSHLEYRLGGVFGEFAQARGFASGQDYRLSRRSSGVAGWHGIGHWGAPPRGRGPPLTLLTASWRSST